MPDAVGVTTTTFLVSCTRLKFTLPGGSGTFWQSSTVRSALPRMVGELRPGVECSARKLIWVKRPARGSLAAN